MSGSRPRTARYAAALGTMLVAVIAGAAAVFWQIGQGEAARGDDASPDGGSPADADRAARDGILATPRAVTVPPGSAVVAADAGAPSVAAASGDGATSGGVVAGGGAERPAAPWRPTAEQAYRDSLFLALQAGDTVRALDLTDRWLRRMPADTGALRVSARLAAGSGRVPLARERYGALLALDGRASTREEAARAFAAAGDLDAAIALYDALLAEREDAGWRVARALLHVARNDLAAAARDYAVAAARTDAPEWWRALGDVERWRGRWVPAQQAYAQALRTAPGHAAALDGLVRAGIAETVDALLTTPAYVVLAPAAPRVRDVAEGVFARTGIAGDNTGFLSTHAGSGAGWSPDEGRTVLRASADWRQAGTGGVGAPRADGWQGELGVVRWLGRLRADAALGTARFTGTGDLLTWQAGLEGRAGLARWRTEARRAPAFETLRAGLTLGIGSTGVPLGATSLAGTASVPLVRGADAWVSGEWLALGDGNARRTVQWALRAPVQGPLSVVWASGVMGFASREATYWTPSLFASQGLGLEAQWGAQGPFAVAARVLPGIAWVRESARGALPAAQANGVPQLNAGLDAAWRRPWGEVAGSTAYGQDRDGGYRAAFGTLRVTVRW